MTVKGRLRSLIQRFHLAFDGWVGMLNITQPLLGALSEKPHRQIPLSDFEKYSYSKKTHFREFNVLPKFRWQSPSTCDLKVYQDMLVYTFIQDNFSPGARLLEIGGGTSRIIEALKNDYEIWNLDKLEGVGFGPKSIWKQSAFRLVRDYIGNFSKELPDEYFDLVFSISTVEHFPNDDTSVDNILDDMQRLLKPGGYSLHAVDGLKYEDNYFIHPVVTKAHVRGWIPFSAVTFDQIDNDRDLWGLPKYAFYTRWYPLVKKPLKTFGFPFSINILWQK